MSVCAKFGIDRVNGHGDIAGRKVSKKVLDKVGPGGGAREGPLQPPRLEVVI